MKIKLTSVHVDDQNKALHFYTEVLGFSKKSDFSNGSFRWLTVASPEEPSGTELQLALNNNPAAKAYQQAIFQQSQPAAMFFTDDVKGDYERIKARGAEFTIATHRGDRLDHCDAERYLRQPYSAHPVGPLFTLRKRRWLIANSTHRVQPWGRRYKKRGKSGRSSRQRAAPLAGKSLAGA